MILRGSQSKDVYADDNRVAGVSAGPLIAAAVIAVALVLRRAHLGRRSLYLGAAAVVVLVVWGSGVIELPQAGQVARDLGGALGPYTYLVVGLMALLETAGALGLVAPGELAVVIGGVTAGQGHTDLVTLIAVVWGCAFTGDLISYSLGRRLGRGWLIRYGPAVKLTPARLEQVESFLARHGGKTIVLGRFVGVVRALAPFVAGSSKMAARRFVPASFVATGLWSSTFCLLGYVFWQSFDQAVEVAQEGSLAFVAVLAAVTAMVVLYRRRYRRTPAGSRPR